MTVDSPEYGFITERILKKVQKHMNWSKAKSLNWYKTDNPMLGGISPARMWIIGRGEKLEKVIDFMISENYREPMGEDDLD